jgi:hypothetical protein
VDTVIHFQDGSKQRVVARLTIDEPQTAFEGDRKAVREAAE